ncbi:MAG: hypothetical protein JXB62_08840 [Pirellulales bacterium]|nr:hypothetical protein [Pirellulales bacterium]
MNWLVVIMVAAGMFCCEALDADEIRVAAPPPASLELAPFYQKYVSAHGLPVVGSAKVSDFALLEAAYLIDQMLAARPDVRKVLIEKGIRCTVMAASEMTTDVPEHSGMRPKKYWDQRARGLGASLACPVVRTRTRITSRVSPSA